MKLKYVAILLILIAPIFLIKSSNISITNSYPELSLKSSNSIVFNNTAYSFSSKFRVKASAFGYEERVFNFNHSDPEKIVALNEIPLKVIFKITPTLNPEVYIDKVLIKDLQNISLLKGSHDIEIIQKNYLTYKSQLEIDSYSRQLLVPVILTAIEKTISVSSQPKGAFVSLNNGGFNITPDNLTLNKKTNSLVIKKEGFVTQNLKIEVINNNFEQKNYILIPAKDMLSIKTSPSSGAVFLDDQYIGLSPLQIKNPMKGRVVITKYGYKDSNIIINKNNKLINIELVPDMSLVTFNIMPKADIFINNKLVKTIANVAQLQKVKHKITFKADGYRSITRLVEPLTDLFTISESMLTEKQAVLNESPPRIKNSIKSDMRLFLPGNVKLGSSKNESRRDINEVIRNVNLSKHFYISENLITDTQFNMFKNIKSSSDLPVNKITWVEAALFCNWLSARENLEPFYNFNGNSLKSFNSNATGYRLPTEAEWEYVSKHNSKNKLIYSWGENRSITKLVGNIADESTKDFLSNFVEGYNDGFDGRSPVGSFKSNQNGIKDLTGNLSEWVNDFYTSDIISPDIVLQNYYGPLFGSKHTIKGSNYKSALPQQLGISYRTYGSGADELVGFRVARWIY